MGMILLSCFLDSLILFWYNRKNNSSHLVLKFLACYISLILLTNILNQFDFSTFLYRLFPSFIVYTLLLFFISQKREWNKIILKAILLMSSVVFSELSTSIIIMIAAGDGDLENLLKNYLFGIISLLISRVVEMILLHLVSVFSQTNAIKKNIKWHFFSVVIVLAYLYMVVYCFIKGRIDSSVVGIAFISNIAFLTVILVIYFLYLNTLRNVEIQKSEIKMLKEKNKKDIEYYKEIDNLNQQIRKIHHDLKNHILIADSIKSYDTGEEYLRSLDEYFEKYCNKANSGNNILDILLEKKYEECEEKGIRFRFNVDFSKGDFINLIDLGTIFGNIIDNAIEACERIGEGRQKTISLVVNTIENFIFIKISNPVDIVKKEGGRLFSIKRKQQEEGLGLMCLQETLKKYNGSYSYEIVDHLFNVTIVIPDNH